MEKEKTYAFCALLSRMKYISRWGLMRQSRTETVSEHTVETAILSHVLALLARDTLGQQVRPEVVAVAALYHDASEILTGDLPTPVKYKNEELKNAYKEVERESATQLAALLPDELQETLRPCLTGQVLKPEEATLLKAADRISALVKCIEEGAAGNNEFTSAKAQQIKLLKEMDCPAAELFLKEFLPCYEQNLDELVRF
ncbi:5'-deoxynucleotidase [Ruminococcaceae bacterium OttesenSCG-928-I18]|nr:5'-deoxynucleotidase [Ruminococcaceae bacterium OttesenSCG-928-I18]